MKPPHVSAAARKVSRTRSGSFAPKFWPAIGAAANAIAIAGRKIDCITRMPMPNPACAAAPKVADDPVDDAHEQGHERELAAGGQADVEQAPPRRESRPPLRAIERHVVLEPRK